MLLFADEKMSPVALGSEKWTRNPVTVKRIVTRSRLDRTHDDGSKGKWRMNGKCRVKSHFILQCC
jgi:hypothetical protein